MATIWTQSKRPLRMRRRRRHKPSLIAVRTVIGYGSPKAGTNKVHGEALGAADTAATKKFFGFPEDQNFYVPEDALANWRKAVRARRGSLRTNGSKRFEQLRAAVSGPGCGV